LGSPADLLRAGADHSRDGIGRDRPDWPKNPRALAGRLRRAQTFLRALGIEIAFSREGHAGSRIIRIHAIPEVSTVSIGNSAQFFASHNRDGRLYPIADGADAKSPTTTSS
jgi:hypothetical protein